MKAYIQSKESKCTLNLSHKEMHLLQRVCENTANPGIAVIQPDEQEFAIAIIQMMRRGVWHHFGTRCLTYEEKEK